MLIAIENKRNASSKLRLVLQEVCKIANEVHKSKRQISIKASMENSTNFKPAL